MDKFTQNLVEQVQQQEKQHQRSGSQQSQAGSATGGNQQIQWNVKNAFDYIAEQIEQDPSKAPQIAKALRQDGSELSRTLCRTQS